MLKGKLRVERPFLLVAVALIALATLAVPFQAFSQSCSLCYTQAASAGTRMIQALRSGILYHKRNQVRRADDAPDSDRSW
jgi:hypothetical protein